MRIELATERNVYVLALCVTDATSEPVASSAISRRKTVVAAAVRGVAVESVRHSRLPGVDCARSPLVLDSTVQPASTALLESSRFTAMRAASLPKP